MNIRDIFANAIGYSDKRKYFAIESKLSAEDRKKLKDSDFGVPELRKFPLNDESHVRSALRYFKSCPIKYRKELAVNIVKKAKEYNMELDNSKNPYIAQYVK